MELRFLMELLQFGTAPALILVAIMLYQIKTDMSARMKSVEKKIESVEKTQKEETTRVRCVERDYITKQEHYRHISGWRGELHYLEKKLDDNHAKTTELLNTTVSRLVDRIGELGDRRKNP